MEGYGFMQTVQVVSNTFCQISKAFFIKSLEFEMILKSKMQSPVQQGTIVMLNPIQTIQELTPTQFENTAWHIP